MEQSFSDSAMPRDLIASPTTVPIRAAGAVAPALPGRVALVRCLCLPREADGTGTGNGNPDGKKPIFSGDAAPDCAAGVPLPVSVKADRMSTEERKPRRKEEERSFAEEASSLGLILISPTVWAFHFMASYAATSMVCVKFPGTVGVAELQWIVGVLTAVALAAILATGVIAWRQWDFLDDYDHTHHRGRNEDRHEFLGHAAFLLSVVSFIGTLYVALPVWLTGAC